MLDKPHAARNFVSLLRQHRQPQGRRPQAGARSEPACRPLCARSGLFPAIRRHPPPADDARSCAARRGADRGRHHRRLSAVRPERPAAHRHVRRRAPSQPRLFPPHPRLRDAASGRRAPSGQRQDRIVQRRAANAASRLYRQRGQRRRDSGLRAGLSGDGGPVVAADPAAGANRARPRSRPARMAG